MAHLNIRGMITVVQAIDRGNLADYQLQVANMVESISIGMLMMKLQQAFTKLLNEDVSKITEDSAKYPTDPGKRSLILQADELQYKLDNAQMDTETESSRTLFDTAKQQVTNDVEAQKNIVSIDESIVSLQSTATNLIQQGSSYGR